MTRSLLAGEVVRLSMRGKDYLKWPKGGPEVLNVAKGLVVMAKVNSLNIIESYVDKLADGRISETLALVSCAVPPGTLLSVEGGGGGTLLGKTCA